ncbi:hypothetical protein [Infirmifilum sp.]|uniref:hypothetical protein n=1 Tax=Infirmifilum sp. TaxID=2856575 RepID=UPI003D0EACB7
MGGVTLGAAFALGVLYGRKAGARPVEVPPRIVYLPASRAGVEGGGVLPVDVLREYGLVGGVDEVLRKAEEYFNALRARDESLWALAQASRLLNEGRISPATYREVTWRHMRRLVESSRQCEVLEGELRRAIREAARAGAAGSRAALSSESLPV